MKTVNMHVAQSTLSRLVRELKQGQETEIIISIAGKPAAKLIPVHGHAADERPLGLFRNQAGIADHFAGNDKEIEKLFEESEIFPKE